MKHFGEPKSHRQPGSRGGILAVKPRLKRASLDPSGQPVVPFSRRTFTKPRQPGDARKLPHHLVRRTPDEEINRRERATDGEGSKEGTQHTENKRGNPMKKKLSAALSALVLSACAAPEQEVGVPRPLPDGGQITYLRIAIIEYPTELQVIKMCQPQGVPQMAIGPGCAKVTGGTNRIYVLHVPRDGSQIVNHYDVLAQWGHELWHLAGGRHSCAGSEGLFRRGGCQKAVFPKATTVNSKRINP